MEESLSSSRGRVVGGVGGFMLHFWKNSRSWEKAVGEERLGSLW